MLHSPLLWLDGAHPVEMVASNLRHVLAVVSRLDAKGVGIIRAWIERARDVSVRVVVLVHATCPTNCADLSALASLAKGHTDKRKFFVRPLTHWGEALTWVRLDYGKDSPPLLWIAAAGNLGLDRPEPHNGHVLLTPDAGMDEQFATWYSGVEALAVPLNQRTSAIPPLVPAQGTIEGHLAWEAYVEQCRAATTVPTPMDRGPEAHSTCDSAQSNAPKATPEHIAEEVRKETGILKPDPLVPIVSQLFQQGFHVTLDKGSRIPPLEVPINAQLFGIDRVRQRGVILRRVEYNISILDEKINKELEKHRKAASELLPKFTFALADGNRWMPLSAKALYERELHKAEEAGSKTLRAVIGGNTKAFVASKRDIVLKAAQQHYHEFNPGQQIPEEDITKILDALESRFDKALTRKFVPALSEVGTTFRAPRAGDSDANWAVARRLLLSVAEYPRKVIKDYNYFFRGLQVEPEELLDAMNVLGDHIVSRAADRHAEQVAKDELDCLGAIEDSDLSDRDKCAEVVALLHGTKNISQIKATVQEGRSNKVPDDRPGAAAEAH
jgi:hypothetical protein